MGPTSAANRPSVGRRELLGSIASMALAAGASDAAGQSFVPRSQGSKILVAYFTRTGNTRVIARQIQRALQADLFEIEPASPYPEDYEETVAQAVRERDSGYRPPLKASVNEISFYEVVFLGFPVWGETAPPVIRAFPLAARSFRKDGRAVHHARRLWPRAEHECRERARAARAHSRSIHHGSRSGATDNDAGLPMVRSRECPQVAIEGNMAESIEGKVVVITGASSGLGEATARHLARHGARLVLGARRIDRLKALANELSLGEDAAVQTDVTQPGQVKRLVDQAVKITAVSTCFSTMPG